MIRGDLAETEEPWPIDKVVVAKIIPLALRVCLDRNVSILIALSRHRTDILRRRSIPFKGIIWVTSSVVPSRRSFVSLSFLHGFFFTAICKKLGFFFLRVPYSSACKHLFLVKWNFSSTPLHDAPNFSRLRPPSGNGTDRDPSTGSPIQPEGVSVPRKRCTLP